MQKEVKPWCTALKDIVVFSLVIVPCQWTWLPLRCSFLLKKEGLWSATLWMAGSCCVGYDCSICTGRSQKLQARGADIIHISLVCILIRTVDGNDDHTVWHLQLKMCIPFSSSASFLASQVEDIECKEQLVQETSRCVQWQMLCVVRLPGAVEQFYLSIALHCPYCLMLSFILCLLRSLPPPLFFLSLSLCCYLTPWIVGGVQAWRWWWSIWNRWPSRHASSWHWGGPSAYQS